MQVKIQNFYIFSDIYSLEDFLYRLVNFDIFNFDNKTDKIIILINHMIIQEYSCRDGSSKQHLLLSICV